jgi:hypothetical protein
VHLVLEGLVLRLGYGQLLHRAAIGRLVFQAMLLSILELLRPRAGALGRHRSTHFSEAPVCESSALIPEFLTITFRNKHGQELISRQQ